MWFLTVKNLKKNFMDEFGLSCRCLINKAYRRIVKTYTADTGFSITSITMSVTLTRYTNKVSLWVCLPKESISANLQNKLIIIIN